MKVKIFLFAISYSKEIGGAQKVFITTVNELSKMDCKVVVILPDNSLVPLINSKSVKIYIVNYSTLKCFLEIYKIFSDNNFDIINTYLPKSSFVISIVNLFIKKKPIYCTLLNAIIHEKLNIIQKLVYPFAYFVLSKLCDGFIVNSEQNKRHFINTILIKSNFIKVIFSGIEINKYITIPAITKDDNKLIIGYVGRLSIEKGPYYLLKSLTYLKDINFECLIIGDGPCRASLEDYAKINKIHEKIKFYGHQKNVNEYINLMDVIVVPSLNETFGLTIIESFALNKIVIASNVGGIPEIVKHGITGFLFPPRDSLQLSKWIKFINNNKILLLEMGKKANKYVKNNFTSQKMAENTYDYLTKIR